MLDPEKIPQIAQKLQTRISERFPGASLAEVAGQVVVAAQQAQERLIEIQRPHIPLRIARILLLASLLGMIAWIVSHLNPAAELRKWSGVKELISILEPALGSSVFIGAFVLFVWGLEDRWKQRKALAALHELRSLAHVVDIHQLTKDPQHVLRKIPSTTNSPKRTLNAVELGRYFDYCSELLALISKVAALYAQGLSDPVALKGVDEIENLASGLSRKVWQKMALLPQFETMAKRDRPLPVYDMPVPAAEPSVPEFKPKDGTESG